MLCGTHPVSVPGMCCRPMSIPARPRPRRRASLYPERFKRDGNEGEGAAERPLVRFADVGCGFGGLLIRLLPLYPDKLMVGFELRYKVRLDFRALQIKIWGAPRRCHFAVPCCPTSWAVHF